MNYLALFVLDNPDFLESVLKKLADEGFVGATIIDSTGLFNHQKKLIPIRYLYSITEADAKDNVTVFMILENKEAAQKVLALVESVVGNLNGPQNGVFAAWPLEIVKGLDIKATSRKSTS